MCDINSSSENLNIKKSSDTWSRQHTLLLIEALRKCPCLYNPLDRNFVNKVKRSEKLNVMLNEIKNIKIGDTIQYIKNKIRTLQNQISRENSKVMNSKKCGASADEVYAPKLWCYSELAFLLHCNDSEPSTSNINHIEVDHIESAEVFIHKPKETLKKNKTKIQEEMRFAALNMMKQSKDLLQQRRKQKLSKEEEFCRYLCNELKRIKFENNFQELKADLLKLVLKIIEEDNILHLNQEPAQISRSPVEDVKEIIYKYRSKSSSSSVNSISPYPTYDSYDNSQNSIVFASPINSPLPQLPINKNVTEQSVQIFLPSSQCIPSSTFKPSSTFIPYSSINQIINRKKYQNIQILDNRIIKQNFCMSVSCDIVA